MKIHVVHRAPNELGSNTISRNYNPKLHPFEKAREVQRAVVAAKMEKIFSKPLVAVLDGHRDSICSMARCHNKINDFFTGSADGEIRHWNLPNQSCIKSILGHKGFVKGLVTTYNDEALLTCGDEGLVKYWSLESMKPINKVDLDEVEDSGNLVPHSQSDVNSLYRQINPDKIWTAQSPINAIDSHWTQSKFVTGSEMIELWDIARSNTIKTYELSKSLAVILAVKFNPQENSILAVSSMDNKIALLDIRQKKPTIKVKLSMRSNSLSWNPTKTMNLTVANEDFNLYTFDINYRKLLDRLDVDYSPNGEEFVASSYDHTVRIFRAQEGRSRDVYHGRRMQIVSACRYSGNGQFILSGSGDFCVRIWKAKAWARLGPRTAKEKAAIAYREALKKRHKNVPEARRILMYHRVPKFVKRASQIRREMHEAELRRELNVELHSKVEDSKSKTVKEKVVKNIE